MMEMMRQKQRWFKANTAEMWHLKNLPEIQKKQQSIRGKKMNGFKSTKGM